MEHQKIAELEHVADVARAAGKRGPMTKIERLERWADVLERQPARRLATLHGTEFGTWAQRRVMRADNSPLTVAFEDPVLREEGLKSDRLGDAIEFFGLSEEEAHRIFCYCYYGSTMLSDEVASRIRGAANRLKAQPLPLSAFVGVSAAGVLATVLSVF